MRGKNDAEQQSEEGQETVTQDRRAHSPDGMNNSDGAAPSPGGRRLRGSRSVSCPALPAIPSSPAPDGRGAGLLWRWF